jgi:hypothetical protein
MADKSRIRSRKPGVSSPITDSNELVPVFDRKKLLEITGALIEETYERVSGDRFRPREGDRERLAYLKILRDFIALQTMLLKEAKAPLLEGYAQTPVNMRDLLANIRM